VLDLAQRFTDGRVSETALRDLPDSEILGQLTQVKGIGPWTVYGALLIALQRPDVVRSDDLAQRWKPYRSLASSLLLFAAKIRK
jgi:DNA-3-methyladenine glycosylase II